MRFKETIGFPTLAVTSLKLIKITSNFPMSVQFAYHKWQQFEFPLTWLLGLASKYDWLQK